MTTTLLDQTFLAKEYALIQNDPKRDPRQSFRNPASSSTSSSSSSAYPSSSGGGAGGGGGELERLVGVVGPMGSGGLSMPGVEKAMADMEGLSFGSGKKVSGFVARRFDHLFPLKHFLFLSLPPSLPREAKLTLCPLFFPPFLTSFAQSIATRIPDPPSPHETTPTTPPPHPSLPPSPHSPPQV